MTEEKYKEHVKKGWCFAQETANELASESDLRSKLALAIFEKIVSPLHYFLQGNGSGEPTLQPPTEKQIEFARKLEIQNPEKFSREELSKKIDEILKSKRSEKP
jgi:protein-tyrosine-phosphatase